MDNIYNELRDIAAGRWGVEIRNPIYEALRKLSGDITEAVEDSANGYPVNWNPQSIDEELAIIDSSIYGKEVKQAIRDALFKLYKLNQRTRTLVTGLVPFSAEWSEPTDPEDLAKITNFEDSTDPLSDLATVLEGCGLFTNVTYSADSTSRVLTAYVGELEFLTYTGTYVTDQPQGFSNFWWYQVKITNTMYDDVTYPTEYAEGQVVRYPLDQAILRPVEVYVSNNKVLITTIRDTILISKTNDNTVLIALGMGDRVHENITDPYDKIRAFIPISTFVGFTGTSQAWTQSQKLVLSAIVAESNDQSYAQGCYFALTRTSGTNPVGYTPFCDSRLYVSGCFAIED